MLTETHTATTPRGGRPPLLRDTDKIEVLVDNPKRGRCAARFAQYRTGMSVADALAAGVRRDDLLWDIRHSFIAVYRRVVV